MSLSKTSAEKLHVFESKSSYYNPVLKQWKDGTFILNKTHFQFIVEDSDNDQFHLCLPLSTISAVEKRQSSLVYACVVITVGSEKHWFSSFPNRDTVFNLLELFWRETLFAKPYKTVTSIRANIGNSALGKELLGILYDSENTLVAAANALSDQGRQLKDAHEVVEDINNDLGIAEKFIRTMNFKSLLPSFIGSSHQKDKAMMKEELESRQKKYKVTFSFSEIPTESSNWDKGLLIIAADFTLLDDQENTRLKVTKEELQSLEVISPWELRLVKKNKTTKCHLMCPQLSRLLKHMSFFPDIKGKIIYEADTSAYETASCSSSSSMVSALSSPVDSPTRQEIIPEASLQLQENATVISDEEVQEISNILSNLKSLAAEVATEQKSHMERLDNLIIDVDKTEVRINADNKKMKKMI